MYDSYVTTIIADGYGTLEELNEYPKSFIGGDIKSRGQLGLTILNDRFPSVNWYTSKSNGTEVDILGLSHTMEWGCVEVKTNSRPDNGSGESKWQSSYFDWTNVPQTEENIVSHTYTDPPFLNEKPDAYRKRLGVNGTIPEEMNGRRMYMLIAESSNGVMFNEKCKYVTMNSLNESLLVECPDGYWYLTHKQLEECFAGYARAWLRVQETDYAKFKSNDKYLYTVALYDFPQKCFSTYTEKQMEIAKTIFNKKQKQQ